MSEEIALAHADMAEIARLRAELEAAHRKIEMTEADNAALIGILEHAARMFTIKGARAVISAALADKSPGAALLAEMDAARAVVAAMREIDHHEVGAYEVTWSTMPEPCEACVEMREIAEQALKAYDAATKARGE